jgi:hypothetical protein
VRCTDDSQELLTITSSKLLRRWGIATQKSIAQLIKHSKRLGLKKEGIGDIRRAQKFYHGYSHPSLFTLASHMSFETESGLYVGCSFDEGEIEQYRKEAAGRVGLAKVFSNCVEAVSHNVSIEKAPTRRIQPLKK